MSVEQRVITKNVSESNSMSKLSNLSVACSVAGLGLLGVILVGPVNAMDDKSVHLACDCAFCFLAAAVALGIIASLISIFKKDSANSSKSQHSEGNKVPKVLVRTSGKSVSTSPNKTAVTNGMKMSDANSFKAAENVNADSKVTEGDGTAEKSKTRCSLLDSRKQHPVTENSLVPVKKSSNPSFSDLFRTGSPCQVAENYDYSSTKDLANSPVSEVVATRTMRFLADGNVQEELKVQRTIFQYPKVGMSYQQSVPANSNLHNQETFGKCVTSPTNHVSDVISKLESFNF